MKGNRKGNKVGTGAKETKTKKAGCPRGVFLSTAKNNLPKERNK